MYNTIYIKLYLACSMTKIVFNDSYRFLNYIIVLWGLHWYNNSIVFSVCAAWNELYMLTILFCSNILNDVDFLFCCLHNPNIFICTFECEAHITFTWYTMKLLSELGICLTSIHLLNSFQEELLIVWNVIRLLLCSDVL